MIINFNGGGSSVTVVDNLNSTSATAALSAKQGKVLNDTKQANISDLTTIRNGAASGATAVQPATLNSYTPTTGFCTINGSAITTGDELVITGGDPNSEKVVECTQAQYDALTGYATNTTYVITDAATINMDNYATVSSVTALETTVAGKADKQSVTANDNTSYYSSVARFPKWNSQGVITGNDNSNWGASWSYVNGSSKNIMAKDAATFTIYGPEAAGTSGQILKSTGSGAPQWANASTILGGLTIWCGSQADYDAMASHSSTTLYIIND